jgi:SOS-response transcriptional repressor LexA
MTGERQRPDDTERDQQPFQYDDERLAEAIGHLLEADADGPLWRDPRFIDWLKAEARENDRSARRRTDCELAAQGRAMVARLRARQLGIARAAEAPRLRPPSVPETPGDLLAVAARERAAPVVELGVAAGVGRELWDEMPDQWVELPIEVPDDRRYLALRIVGESMAPVMHTDDVVLVRVGPDVKVDTVIVARHPDDGYVCKRVSRVRKRGIELASLEAGRPLITIPRDPALVVGTVLLVWCTHRERAVQLEQA